MIREAERLAFDAGGSQRAPAQPKWPGRRRRSPVRRGRKNRAGQVGSPWRGKGRAVLAGRERVTSAIED
jgi:hypothetical protein